MADSHLHLQERTDPTPKSKPQPSKSAIPVPFAYYPSDDGTDENLLILFHGLGDTHIPFAKLGRTLKLPQTAILALRATEQIPFFDQGAYQWYPAFDNLGDQIQHPNPTHALHWLSSLLSLLTTSLHWSPHQIHLFGFGQGGSIAAELAIKFWKDQLSSSSSNTSLGSLIAISAPLISHPTLQTPSPTPVLFVHRPQPSDDALPPSTLGSYKKGFQTVTEVKLGANKSGMPSSREEMEPIMRFWSERLGKRRMDGLYEVMSGTAS
ncbi:hypothetical protein FA15DRAFT_760156, partial [Coprinopsis marcescibilis]